METDEEPVDVYGLNLSVQQHNAIVGDFGKERQKQMMLSLKSK